MNRLTLRRHVVLKVCHNDPQLDTPPRHELEISRHIAQCDPKHPGLKYIRTIQDTFDIPTANGSHLCLVYQPMRMPLSRFERAVGGMSNYLLMRWTMKHLLTALKYLHEDCKVIHTGKIIPCPGFLSLTTEKDIKSSNLMITVEDGFRFDDLEHAERADPSPRKELADRTIYLSRTEWPEMRSYDGVYMVLADFDRAVRVTGSERFTYFIQPNRLRAPEVLLGVPWSYPVDIWNLGCLVCILF